MWRKGNPGTLLVGMEIGAATMGNSLDVPQKLKNSTSVWSSYSTFGYLSKKYEESNLNRYIQPYVHCGIIYNSQDMEIAHWWMNGWRRVYNTVEYYPAIKKICVILPLWQHGWTLRILHSISPSDKNWYYIISYRCEILKFF